MFRGKLDGRILILSLLVGLVYLSPHLVYSFTNNPYNPLSMEITISTIDEAHYAAGVMEVLEGNFIASDFVTFENKESGPYVFAPVPLFIMGIFAKAIGGIKNAVIFSDFFISAIIFLLFYLFSHLFLKSKMLSIISSLTLVFFHGFFVPPTSISIDGLIRHIGIRLFNLDGGYAPFWFSRFVQPQIGTIMFLLAILFLFWALQKKQLKLYLLAGIFFALNFYSYFYFWTYLIVFFPLLMMFLFFKKSKRRFVGASITALVGGVLALPYLFNLITVESTDLTTRLGIELGRFVETISLLYLFLIVFAWLIVKNKDFTFYFLNLLLFSGVAVLNVQLILNYTIHNNHWNSRVIILVLIPYLFYLAKATYRRIKLPDVSKKLAVVIIIIMFVMAANIQAREVYAAKEGNRFREGGAEMIEWLNLNTNSETVVLSSDLKWNILIPAYTPSNVYFPHSISTIASDEELSERFIRTFKILNKSSDYTETQLKIEHCCTEAHKKKRGSKFESVEIELAPYIFAYELSDYKRKGLLKYRDLNSEPVNKLIDKYINHPFETNQIRDYKVDYILLTKEEKYLTNSLISELEGENVFESDEFTIIRI